MPKSLAGSGKDYVEIQIKTTKKEKMWNLQGAGENVNRDYGVAEPVDWVGILKDRLIKYLYKIPRYFPSFAEKSQERYVLVYARLMPERGTVKFQVPHMKSFDRRYGASFEIEIKDLPDAVLKFIKNQENILLGRKIKGSKGRLLQKHALYPTVKILEDSITTELSSEDTTKLLDIVLDPKHTAEAEKMLEAALAPNLDLKLKPWGDTHTKQEGHNEDNNL